jgi:hypothetical protein
MAGGGPGVSRPKPRSGGDLGDLRAGLHHGHKGLGRTADGIGDGKAEFGLMAEARGVELGVVEAFVVEGEADHAGGSDGFDQADFAGGGGHR